MSEPSTPTVGIVGAGFVGTAVLNHFKYYTDVKVYDKYKKGLSTLREAVSQDVIFVCVPTPEGENGECDTSILESALEDVWSTCIRAKQIIRCILYK
jgi:UDP-N-acetyl-D-mannosaminuronate dehydrogenase